MKISEITTEQLRNFLRLDDSSFNDELEKEKESAISFIVEYTGLTKKEIDQYEDLSQAVFVLVSDFFENHLYIQGGVGQEVKLNKTIETILNHHRTIFV
ncbi:MAG: phage gp6-like head-tail connector protein [Lachnospiraceae bacterium]|nr:phage gp6-like head-tail connector protein [Lachnospiraceae bacterium]